MLAAVLCTQHRCSRVSGTVSQRSPESQGAVAHGDHRSSHPPVFEVSEHLSPGFGRLPVAVGAGDQLFRPVGTDPDDDQTTRTVLLETYQEMHSIGPHIDEVRLGEVAAFGRAYSSDQLSMSRVTVDADRPASVPKNSSKAGAKSPVDRPRRSNTGNTSATFEDLRQP